MMGDYLSWVPGAQGVRGDPDEVQKAIKAFRIFATRIQTENGSYTMDHSASVLLFDKDGNFVLPIGCQQPIKEVMAQLDIVFD